MPTGDSLSESGVGVGGQEQHEARIEALFDHMNVFCDQEVAQQRRCSFTDGMKIQEGVAGCVHSSSLSE